MSQASVSLLHSGNVWHGSRVAHQWLRSDAAMGEPLRTSEGPRGSEHVPRASSALASPPTFTAVLGWSRRQRLRESHEPMQVLESGCEPLPLGFCLCGMGGEGSCQFPPVLARIVFTFIVILGPGNSGLYHLKAGPRMLVCTLMFRAMSSTKARKWRYQNVPQKRNG